MQLPEFLQSVSEPETNNNKPSKLMGAWNAIKPSRAFVMGAGAVVLTGAISIHFYNNEEKVISTVLKEPDMALTALDSDTTLIKQGDNVAIRYKGIICPVTMSWPETVTLTLGNTGDASISPSDESPVSTILGTLGVTRNVTIKRELDKNAKDLMNDFYSHAENCYDKILELSSGTKDSTQNSTQPAAPEF